MKLGRRQFAAACACAGAVGANRQGRGATPADRRKARSRVAVIEAESYEDSLEQRLLPFIQQYTPNIRGRSVLLKPNLVEDLPGPVHTHPVPIKAAAQCFLSLGARQVIVGEGRVTKETPKPF